MTTDFIFLYMCVLVYGPKFLLYSTPFGDEKYFCNQKSVSRSHCPQASFKLNPSITFSKDCILCKNYCKEK